MKTFKTSLKEALLFKKSFVCLGIDPHPDHWPECWEDIQKKSDGASMVRHWGECLLRASSELSTVKFQSAFFEAMGSEGFTVLKDLCWFAKDKGFTVILDAKRGDISSTMAAYGRMAFDHFQADAMTVLPWMGLDCVDALRPWLEKGRGAYLVWVSSNPGGRLLQDGGTLPGRRMLLDALAGWERELGWDGAVGLVLGATKIDTLPEDDFERALQYPLLMPGFGAQGAKVSPQRMSAILNQGIGIFPQSRSLTGVGGSKTDSALNACQSVPDYEALVKSRVSTHGEQFKVSR